MALSLMKLWVIWKINKKWDKTIKGLTKLGLAKVTKTDNALVVEVVE
jgi:hypothetical protein